MSTAPSEAGRLRAPATRDGADGQPQRGRRLGLALVVIATAQLMLLGGRAGAILGRRRVFVAGIILFPIASLLGGFATSQAWLLGARALQVVGGAIVAPTALSLVTTTFPEGPPRNRAMGVYAAMSVAGGAIGLLAGGLLTTYSSWRCGLVVRIPSGLALTLRSPLGLGATTRRRGAVHPSAAVN